MGKNMQVFVRLFPLPERDWKYLEISMDFKDIFIQSSVLSSSHAHLIECFEGKPVDKYVQFHTSGIFVNNTQEEIYKTISCDIFSKVFSGQNVILLVNGQHNSGKSFTMTGYNGSYENRGISLRFVQDLFQEIEMRKNSLQTDVYVSHLEFAAETFIDLLNEPASILSNFKQTTKIKVKSKEQLVKTLILSEKKRRIEGFSHCSTSVITFYLKCTSKVKSQPYDYLPHIQLVELSGTETALSANSCQQKANRDMAAMSLHLASRGTGTAFRAPSRLVSFLADTWNCSFIRIICHLKPSSDKRNLNMSTLVFTSRLLQRPIYTLSVQRIDNPANTLSYALEVITRLEEELLVREMIEGEGFRHVGTVNQREMDSVLNACSDFLEGNTSIEALLSTAHPHILIRALKMKFDSLNYKVLDNRGSVVSAISRIDRASKVSNITVSKKRLGSARKRLSAVESITPSAQSNYDELVLIDVKHPQEIPDRQTIEAEFYTRYHDLKTQLDLATENYLNAQRIRDEVYEEYGQIKKKAREEKILDEEIAWKKRLELGECVDQDGRPVWTTFSEKPAQEAAASARKEVLEALHVFTIARDTLTELKANIEEKIQNYMETAYGLGVPTVDADESNLCYAERQDTSKLHQDQASDDKKIKFLFHHLQRAKPNSNQFKKKPTWMT